MKKFKNSRTEQKVIEISQLSSIEMENDSITIRCKFNFHYFSIQKGGQDFKEWNHNQLVKLLNKLKNYSENSLEYWARQPIGKGIGHVLEIYGKFPVKNTEFIEPKSIPIEAQWSRFRLESSVRLIGFTIPNTYFDKAHQYTSKRYDTNTFYVVFLDKEHKFYKTEKK